MIVIAMSVSAMSFGCIQTMSQCNEKISAHTFAVAKPWNDRIGALPQKLAIVHRRPANRWRRVKGKILMPIASARLPKLSLSAADSCRYWLSVAATLMIELPAPPASKRRHGTPIDG